MQAIVREAMAHGAVGFASSTSPAHNGEGGLPMPSRLATDEEMAALVGAMGEGGRGVYMLTKGGHTPMPFLESLAAATDRPVMVAALLHNAVNPGAVFADLDAIAAANERGHRLLGQVSCCPLTMDFTLASPYPVEGLVQLEAGARPRGRGAEARARRPVRFATPCAPSCARRRRSASSTASGTRSTSSRSRRPDNARFEQRSIADIAREPKGAIRSTRCSTSRSTKTSPPSSPRSSSTATKPPSAGC